MGSARNYGRYLVRRGTVYFFRVCIPRDLAVSTGLREVRMSLRTGSLRDAKAKALVLAGYASSAFDVIRTGAGMATLDRDTLRSVVVQYFHEQLAKYEEAMLGSGPRTLGRNVEALSKLEQAREKSNMELMLCDFSAVQEPVRRVAAQLALVEVSDSTLHRRIGQEVLKANIDAMNILMHRLQGDYTFEEAVFARYKVEQGERRAVAPAEIPKDEGIRFFALVEEYCKLKIGTRQWSGRSEKELPKRCDILKFVIGDVPVDTMNGDVALHVLDVLQRLPKRLNAKRYKGKSLDELLEMEDQETLSDKSVNMSMDLAASLLKFAIKQGYVRVNCFEGVRLRETMRDEDRRLSFAEDDLAKVFSPSTYLPWSKNDPSRYWLPILGLYTGARLEELAQLHVEDVCVAHGELVLDINHKGEKRIKTKSAKRIIPVHTQVRLDLGFEKYVEGLRSAKEKRLFPNLTQVQERYGHKPSRDFGRYLRRIGIGERKSFHSLRHTFIGFLRNQGIPDEHIATVTGHKQGDKSPIPPHYRKELEIKFKVEKVIKHVEFGVDFDWLKL